MPGAVGLYVVIQLYTLLYAEHHMHTSAQTNLYRLVDLKLLFCRTSLYGRSSHSNAPFPGWQEQTFSLRLADKSGTFAKRQSPGDNRCLPDHIECHILSVVILVEGVGADGQGHCALSTMEWIHKALPYKVISLQHNESRREILPRMLPPQHTDPHHDQTHNFTGSREQTNWAPLLWGKANIQKCATS